MVADIVVVARLILDNHHFSASRLPVMATLISVPAKYISTAHTSIATTAFAGALLAGWLGGKWKDLCTNSVARESTIVLQASFCCPSFVFPECSADIVKAGL